MSHRIEGSKALNTCESMLNTCTMYQLYLRDAIVLTICKFEEDITITSLFDT